ncbi:hypothetical protein SARC_05263 [Sphaeroforma arctica JP610]|uniref:Gamma-soluble NSF attachment protein n=1 Tax=Sphaeroforma arctica JP610 TaxID=667725 RepID=A0A0L0G2M1_9EUKA|nr:hypothetical protein SARC_05263 [Sphaeroforma arctica JP610]KNC82448.1 hypothetical protein SARC_05263 [Sphaeroforma arctica JP610]|eukprot:XP_014156350.1 hypothetical protein SARC_05263 [Sphaeroforma arctica JP610]
MTSVVKEGKDFIQQAEKCLKSGFFKKPDPQSAVGLYEKAALSFKKARAYRAAMETYLKVADMHQQLDNGFHSARALESAAMMAKDHKQYAEAAGYFSQAGIRYREFGSNDTAGLTLEKGAKFIEKVEPDRAIDMYVDAADLYNDEEKYAQCGECYRKAAMLHLQNQKFAEAIKLLDLQANAFTSADVMEKVYQVYLSIVIVYLRMGDLVAANEKADTWVMKSGWSNSDDGRLADHVIQAYDEGDQELMEATVKKQRFGYLDNEVAKIARGLRVPGAGMKKKKSAVDTPTPASEKENARAADISPTETTAEGLPSDAAAAQAPIHADQQASNITPQPAEAYEDEDEDEEGGLC